METLLAWSRMLSMRPKNKRYGHARNFLGAAFVVVVVGGGGGGGGASSPRTISLVKYNFVPHT